MSSSFSVLLSTLPEGMRSRIQTALDACTNISDVDYLRDAVAGRNIEQITSLLVRNLDLSNVDASALAGLLVAPTVNYISISHLIFPSRLLFLNHSISLITFLLMYVSLMCTIMLGQCP
jgi:hypothetical protein